MNINKKPILIIGGNGKTGSRVNFRLKELGHSTRPVSRSTYPLFDWEMPITWPTAIKGTKAAYVTFQPDLAVPNADKAIAEFARLALENGLEQIVLLSGRGEDGAQRAEEALKNSGIPWTIVRSTWFSQNFSEGFMLEGILDGNLVLPVEETLEPFVDIDDICDVVVAALTEQRHLSKIYEVTGPTSITFAQAVEEISNALERPIKFTSVPIDAFMAEMEKNGTPSEVQWLIHELFTVVLDGRNSNVMNGIQEAIGRPPTTFKDYVTKTVNSGVWSSVLKEALGS